jgi:methylated-DNA-[protein]-cysteine S-methyltransferase
MAFIYIINQLGNYTQLSMKYYTEYKSPIGVLVLISDGSNITWLGIRGQKYAIGQFDDLALNPDLPVFDSTKRWLDIYFSGVMPEFMLPLAPEGTSFRQAVWAILTEIPYGEVVTYGDIAKKIAKQAGKEQMSAQAVGGAVGHNPISIIIPCHRVVGAGGNLTGFASGIDAKIKLLELEHIDMSSFYRPKSL